MSQEAIDPKPQNDQSANPDGSITDAAQATEPNQPDAPADPAMLLDRYECDSCGYIYEPVRGDGDRISAKTPFSEIATTWRCPVCGAPKRQFRNIGPVGSPSGFKENLGYGFGVNTLTPGQKNILIFGALILGFLFFMSLYGLK